MSLFLSREACAGELGVSVRTIRHWDTGRNRVPWSAIRLLRLMRGGDLEQLSPDWRGYVLRGDTIWTPEGHSLKSGEAAWWSLLVRRARAFDTLHARPPPPSAGGGLAERSADLDEYAPSYEARFAPPDAIAAPSIALGRIPPNQLLMLIVQPEQARLLIEASAAHPGAGAAGAGVGAGLVSITTKRALSEGIKQ